MTKVAIRIEHLTKQYQIGARAERYQTLRDSIANTAREAFHRSRRVPHPREGDERSRQFLALKDISLEVECGEVVGVIGHNGAGKSTLLKILSRITEPSSGEAEIHGRVGSLLEVGTGFHLELTGRENIYLSGAILGMRRSEIERKLAEIVEFAGVAEFLETPVKHFSSGMYLRLAFAVAAHLEHEILLVDEVLAVGDAAFQKKCLSRMGEVARQGRTILLVSHSMAAISRLCRKSIVLREGELAFFGDTQDAIDVYVRSLPSATQADLTSRVDRQGTGKARITKLAALDRSGSAREVLQSGGAVTFALTFNAERVSSLRNVLFEIKVSDEIGERLFTLSTFLTGESFDRLPAAGVVYCSVPALLLTPGSYNVTVIVYVNNELADHVIDAAQFTVIESDFFGSGKLVRKKTYGTFLIPHSWHQCEPVLSSAPIEVGLA